MADGWSGSISHKGPFAVALAAELPGPVGVDVECIEPQDSWIQRKVFSDAERRRVECENIDVVRAAVTCFCIKEAVFKALNATIRRDLEFEDIDTFVRQSEQGLWKAVDVRLAERWPTVSAAILTEGDWMVASARCVSEE